MWALKLVLISAAFAANTLTLQSQKSAMPKLGLCMNNPLILVTTAAWYPATIPIGASTDTISFSLLNPTGECTVVSSVQVIIEENSTSAISTGLMALENQYTLCENGSENVSFALNVNIYWPAGTYQFFVESYDQNGNLTGCGWAYVQVGVNGFLKWKEDQN